MSVLHIRYLKPAWSGRPMCLTHPIRRLPALGTRRKETPQEVDNGSVLYVLMSSASFVLLDCRPRDIVHIMCAQGVSLTKSGTAESIKRAPPSRDSWTDPFHRLSQRCGDLQRHKDCVNSCARGPACVCNRVNTRSSQYRGTGERVTLPHSYYSYDTGNTS